MCVYCWHFRRQLVLEAEGHVFGECPANDSARAKIFNGLHVDTKQRIDNSGSRGAKLLQLVASHLKSDWQAFGRCAVQFQQSRRRLRRQFEEMHNRLDIHGYHEKIASRRLAGGKACRHGILFTASQCQDFPCMGSAATPFGLVMWRRAKWMPTISHEMKKIIMVPFSRDHMRRAGQLQVHLRRLNFV